MNCPECGEHCNWYHDKKLDRSVSFCTGRKCGKRWIVEYTELVDNSDDEQFTLGEFNDTATEDNS